MANTKPTSKGWNNLDYVPKDVLGSLEALGIDVVKIAYNEAWALCPGHEARLGKVNNRPNKWSINVETGKHSCFSCGFSGSFTTLVQEVKEYGREGAQQWVRAHGGIPRIQRDVGVSAYRFERDTRIHEWNEARLSIFDAPPRDALERRRVSARSVEHYGILWSDGEDPFWVLPIRSPDTGKLLGYQEKSEDGWVSNKPYGVTKSDTIFGLDVWDSPYIIVVESPLDCAVLYSNGIFGAVATYGAKISQVQLDILFDLGVPVYFALDNDDAGIKASMKIREKYLRSGHSIRFFNYSQFGDKKDVGDSGLTNKDLQWAFANSLTMVRYRPCL